MGDLRAGAAAVRRSPGLVALLLAANLGLAAVVALPVGARLEDDLRHTDASVRMVQGFDHAWWEEWSERQRGSARDVGPEILGMGFAARNLDLLLRGYLPAGLFAGIAAIGVPPAQGDRSLVPDPQVLALGALAMVLQGFLAGGVLGVLRSGQGDWTVRGFLHGSGFYFGRMLRVSLLALAAAGIVFSVWAPMSKVAEVMARESVSERGALAWSVGRFLALLAGLLVVHMVSSFAKVIVVAEERSSACLAFLTAAGLCLRQFPRAAAQYLVLLGGGAILLGAWLALDSFFEPTGFRTQLLFLLLAQAFLAGRIALRLGLLGAQLSLYRTRGLRAA